MPKGVSCFKSFINLSVKPYSLSMGLIVQTDICRYNRKSKVDCAISSAKLACEGGLYSICWRSERKLC